jgi:hypothetical protein
MRNFEFDELIERAFSMGYEYAQKEFMDPRNMDRIGKVAIYGVPAAALGYGSYKLYKFIKRKNEENRALIEELIKNKNKEED